MLVTFESHLRGHGPDNVRMAPDHGPSARVPPVGMVMLWKPQVRRF